MYDFIDFWLVCTLIQIQGLYWFKVMLRFCVFFLCIIWITYPNSCLIILYHFSVLLNSIHLICHGLWFLRILSSIEVTIAIAMLSLHVLYTFPKFHIWEKPLSIGLLAGCNLNSFEMVQYNVIEQLQFHLPKFHLIDHLWKFIFNCGIYVILFVCSIVIFSFQLVIIFSFLPCESCMNIDDSLNLGPCKPLEILGLTHVIQISHLRIWYDMN